MVNIAREAAQAVWGDLGRAEHAMSGWFEPHRAAPQAPAASPATVGNTTTTEEPMSLAADAETWYAEAKAKFAEAEQKLPALIADARKLEGNPIAQVAIAAGEHVAAGILPAQVIALVESAARNALDGYLSIYGQQGATGTQPPAEQQPAA